MKIHSSQQISGLRHQKRLNHQKVQGIRVYDEYCRRIQEYEKIREMSRLELKVALGNLEDNSLTLKAKLFAVHDAANRVSLSYLFYPDFSSLVNRNQSIIYPSSIIRNTIEDIELVSRAISECIQLIKKEGRDSFEREEKNA